MDAWGRGREFGDDKKGGGEGEAGRTSVTCLISVSKMAMRFVEPKPVKKAFECCGEAEEGWRDGGTQRGWPRRI